MDNKMKNRVEICKLKVRHDEVYEKAKEEEEIMNKSFQRVFTVENETMNKSFQSTHSGK